MRSMVLICCAVMPLLSCCLIKPPPQIRPVERYVDEFSPLTEAEFKKAKEDVKKQQHDHP